MAKPTELKVNKDWISRDDDFVHRGGHRSGWDSKAKSNADYVLKGASIPKSKEEQLREIDKLCKNRCRILADGKPVVFSLNPQEETARTDGTRVRVGTKVFDTAKSFVEKADIIVGLTTHEMAHIMHTDFSQLSKAKDKFHKSIINVIEDERIEHLLTEEFPGYGNNLATTKQYFLDEKYKIDKLLEEEKMKGMILSDEEKAAMELYNLFFKFIRYPKDMDEEALARNEVEIDELKKILTPYPMTSEEMFNASVEVYNVLSKGIKKRVEEKKKEKEKAKKELLEELSGIGSDGEPSDEHSEEGRESPKGGKPSPEKGEESDKEEKPKSSPGEDEDEDETPDEDGEEATAESKPGEPEKSASETAKEIKEIIGELMAEFNSDNESGTNVEATPTAIKIKFNEEYIYDKDNKADFVVGEANLTRYNKLLESVKGDARRLASSLFTRVFNESKTLRGMRSGELDESKIVDAAHGIKTVHKQVTQKAIRRLNITILVDESGSMGRQGGDKVDNASKAAILIEKAFEVFPVGQLFMYGFTSDYEGRYNCIFRYREPGLRVKHGAGSIKGRANNRDGHCIRAVANRVRSFTNDPMLYFIISDGQPSAGGYGGYDDTRDAVTEVTKKGFFPIQIGIGGDLTEREQAMMFDEFVHYDTPGQMVDDLRKLILRKAHKIFGL